MTMGHDICIIQLILINAFDYLIHKSDFRIKTMYQRCVDMLVCEIFIPEMVMQSVVTAYIVHIKQNHD